MADNQDKLTPADQKKLDELSKQISTEKAAESKKESPSQQTVAKEPVTSKFKSSTKNANQPAHSGKSKPTTNQASAKTGMLWFVTIVNFLLVGLLVGAGYWFWMQWQTQNQLQADALTKQQSSVAQQQADIARSLSNNQLSETALKQQNQVLQTSIESLLEQIQINQAQVQTNTDNLADVSGRRPSDWVLAEADYLVRMAGRKLWLEKDLKTAVMMLQSADQRLQDIDDPSLIPVREKIAEDINALQHMNQVSLDSIALSLGALAKQVDTLPLLYFTKPVAKNIEQDSETANDWRSNLARNWQQVTENFFKINRKTTEIKPFMSAQEQWLSKEQVKFSLLQAQVATLRENKALYQQSLESVLVMTTDYFDNTHQAVTYFTDKVRELKETEIERHYPQQFLAASLLQEVMQRRVDSRFSAEAAQP